MGTWSLRSIAAVIRSEVRLPAQTWDTVAVDTPSSRPRAAKEVPRSLSWYLMYSRSFSRSPEQSGIRWISA
jgi:hypothetical protein